MTGKVASPAPRRCGTVLRAGTPGGPPATDRLSLDYEARFLRRRRLLTVAGVEVLVDLPEATALADGDLLVDAEGAGIAVEAAPEPLLDIRGDLPRLAWHIGNRHTPCEVGGASLRIRADHVLRDMLERLGAGIEEVTAPFTPEGGAYGMGRTFGHAHGPADAVGHAHHDHPG